MIRDFEKRMKKLAEEQDTKDMQQQAIDAKNEAIAIQAEAKTRARVAGNAQFILRGKSSAALQIYEAL